MRFIDHVRELRRRLFWVVLWFVVASSALFPFFNDIIKLLMRPLGNEKLYYLTPIGGLGFAVKVCMYVGFITTLPILTYHLYRFIAPIVNKRTVRNVSLFVGTSFTLAALGISFAYIVSLPAALRFLTGFNITDVSAMLTVDSYLSFIIAYLFAGAILFQLPLIMVIFDSINPTPPSFWWKYERHMVVAAFIIGMLVTPTPNVLDQVVLAVPIVIMYQIGIGVIYLRHRRRRTLTPITTVAHRSTPIQPVRQQLTASKTRTAIPVTAGSVRSLTTKPVVFDPMMRRSQRPSVRRIPTVRVDRRLPDRAKLLAVPSRPVVRRSIDGILTS